MPPTVPESFAIRMIFPCDLLDNSLICGRATVVEEVDVELADGRQTIAAIAAVTEADPEYKAWLMRGPAFPRCWRVEQDVALLF